MQIEVEIPSYCLIPHNKVKCRFLIRRFGGRKKCSLFKVELFNAVDNWKNIVLPCKECEGKRQVRNVI